MSKLETYKKRELMGKLNLVVTEQLEHISQWQNDGFLTKEEYDIVKNNLLFNEASDKGASLKKLYDKRTNIGIHIGYAEQYIHYYQQSFLTKNELSILLHEELLMKNKIEKSSDRENCFLEIILLKRLNIINSIKFEELKKQIIICQHPKLIRVVLGECYASDYIGNLLRELYDTYEFRITETKIKNRGCEICMTDGKQTFFINHLKTLLGDWKKRVKDANGEKYKYNRDVYYAIRKSRGII